MNANLDDTPKSSSWRWVLGAVAAAAVAWLFFGPPKAVEPTKAPPSQVPADSINLKSSLDSTLAGLKADLQGIGDAASAKTALPQLEKRAAELDKLRELSVNVPADSKAAPAALLASARPALDGSFDKALAIPGVDGVAKPAIDTLRASLDALGKALPFRVREETK